MPDGARRVHYAPVRRYGRERTQIVIALRVVRSVREHRLVTSREVPRHGSPYDAGVQIHQLSPPCLRVHRFDPVPQLGAH